MRCLHVLATVEGSLWERLSFFRNSLLAPLVYVSYLAVAPRCSPPLSSSRSGRDPGV